MFDPFNITSFDHFVATEFKHALIFPIACVMEEVALDNTGADHTFIKKLYKEFFKMPIVSVTDCVHAAVKAAQLYDAGFDQALKTFSAFFYGLYDQERRRFYSACDQYAASLNLKDPCDFIVLDYLERLYSHFPGDKTCQYRVSVTRNYEINPEPESVTISLGELSDLLWDRNMPHMMAEEDQVLYCVINMWLHPQTRSEYTLACGGDPEDPAYSEETREKLRRLKAAASAQYNAELKALRK